MIIPLNTNLNDLFSNIDSKQNPIVERQSVGTSIDCFFIYPLVYPKKSCSAWELYLLLPPTLFQDFKLN